MTYVTPAAVAASFFSADAPDAGFSSAVIEWQKLHGRHGLPWQQSRAAYRVWLSEIMLQQTQVSAVIPYYQKFLSSFPDVHALAQAPSEQVMAHWAGLGYYTRARNLHQCAKRVVAEYGGEFPADPALLRELPGIGRSTAAAITAFSYGTKAAILDGNVKRVLARAFGIHGYPGSKPVEDSMWRLADALLPDNGIEAYTQGLMDLGATVCTRSSPTCLLCPLQQRCVAKADGLTELLPFKKPKAAPKQKQAVMLVLMHQGAVLVERRADLGIWGGLLSLPELDGMQACESGRSPALPQLPADAFDTVIRPFGQAGTGRLLPVMEHVFTHFRLWIHPLLMELAPAAANAQLAVAEDKYQWLPLNQVQDAALPAPVKNLLLSLARDVQCTAR
ncbi:A/G-specific adenine glycosylase [Undibacterium rugosum]|uniref:A/G-specific adenine glycosylase n=1 Tax=Undibacterium rugosum TaxID=2762291 RepID=UPI001B8405DD|nr:A/G-specific adenine glycosylase [Undibacterium rugosum]MBR7778328.1 A/G-specific adenine glycosylase [Undibacterium rugosum]